MSFAPFEDGDFFDFEQGFHNPASPVTLNSTIDPSKMMLNSDSTYERKAFQGPSYEYGSFKQLTGIPNGAVSNFNATNHMVGEPSFNMSSAGPSPHNFSFNDFNMGMDFDVTQQEPLPAYFFPTTTMEAGNFVDPMVVGGPGSSIPPNSSRPRPGMHSRQAEQAKAEQAATKQRQQKLGQQIMQQRQQELMESQASSMAQQNSDPVTNPLVEGRISRLLDQMRHNSTVSSIEEHEDSNEDSFRARSKKDEEDMDEDERMLASEEGKKLTSKERRQLRNKVSARAFRSRRKEYITQLESELAVKSTECNELKARNRNLQDQTDQLTRLTQTLLRHPAFSVFLNDISHDPSILDLPTRLVQQSEEGYVQPKQEQVTENSQETQINMAMMPQTALDMSLLNLGPTNWNSIGSPTFSFQQPQVYSVLELPRPTLLDDHFSLTKLSGKGDAVDESASKFTVPKVELPAFASIAPVAQQESHFDSEGIDKDDPNFALYINDSTVTAPVSSSSTDAFPCAPTVTEEIKLDGKGTTIAFIVRQLPANDAAAIHQINTLFDSLLPTYRRVEALTEHSYC